MTPEGKKSWISVQTPPNDDRMVEVIDANGVKRNAYACYYAFDVVGGKIIELDKPFHDGTWMVDETIPFSKNEMLIFNTPILWREIKNQK